MNYTLVTPVRRHSWVYRVSVAGVPVETAWTLEKAETLAQARKEALGATRFGPQRGAHVVIWAEVC